MAFTSEEVNYLVYRYLLESGFSHSAFVFGSESLIHESTLDVSQVPPGSLVSILQKGVQYVEAETAINEDGTFTEDSKLQSLSLIGAVVQNSILVQKYRKFRDKFEDKADEDNKEAVGVTGELDDGNDMETDVGKDADVRGLADRVMPQDLVTDLSGHKSEVLTCQWNPCFDMLASGSADGTAMLWAMESPGESPQILPHDGGTKKSKEGSDVTTLHWKSDGSCLATGCYDGRARIWTNEGVLQNTLALHRGPVFSIKWNQKGNYLATGSVDTTTIVWDGVTGEVKQQLSMHKDPVLDLDWQSNSTLATCSTDQLVLVWEVGSNVPIKTFSGHKNGVNCIQWDPTGTLLASCSDDKTAKIWSMDKDTCLHDLSEHIGDVYTLKWSPTGAGTDHPNISLVLATASFDSTVRLWNAETGKCLHVMEKHTQPVYSVVFSPDGRYLATGSRDKQCLIWDVRNGNLIREFEAESGIFEMSWNADGTKLAASLENNVVSVLDVRKLAVGL